MSLVGFALTNASITVKVSKFLNFSEFSHVTIEKQNLLKNKRMRKYVRARNQRAFKIHRILPTEDKKQQQQRQALHI